MKYLRRPREDARQTELHRVSTITRAEGRVRQRARLVGAGILAILALTLTSCITGVAPDGWPATHRLPWLSEVVVHTLTWELTFIPALVLVALGWSFWRAARGMRRLDAALMPAGPDVRALIHDLAPARALYVLADDRPIVVCVGLIRPRIALSVGALAQFSPAALRAAVAHEEAHRQRRDPLRLLALRSLAMLLPKTMRASEWYARIELRAEVRADGFARRATSRAALASALHTMIRAQVVSGYALCPPAFSAMVFTGTAAASRFVAASSDGGGMDALGERLRALSASEDAPLPRRRPPALRWRALTSAAFVSSARWLAFVSLPAVALAYINLLAPSFGGTAALACALHV